MLKPRALLLLALASSLLSLLSAGCDVPLEAETRLFACESSSDCLTGFTCKKTLGAENEAISELSTCTRCSVSSFSTPTFQSHPACAQQSATVTQTFDCKLSAAQVGALSPLIRVYGQWSGAYTIDAKSTDTQSVQASISPLAAGWRSGELITVTNTASVLTESGQSIRPFVWQFRAPARDGRAIFLNNSREGTPENILQGSENQADVQIADLDGKGGLDVITASKSGQDSVSIWINENPTTYPLNLVRTASLSSAHTSPTTRRILLGDLDGNPGIDILVVNESAPNEVWSNNGNGEFSRIGDLNNRSDLEKHTNAALGDLDGDGDLDAITTESYAGGNSSVWLQTNGVLKPTNQILRDGLDVAIGDVDNDGDLDALIATETRGVSVWINQGDGTFSDINKNIDLKTPINAIALGDLDGDGDLDAVLAKDGPNQIWLNDGLANFTHFETQTPLDDTDTQDVVLADFNADNALDILFSNGNGPNYIWLNDGSAHFSRSNAAIGGEETSSAAVGDVNNDDTLDIIFAQSSGYYNEIQTNLKKVQNDNPFSVNKDALSRNISIPPDATIEVPFSLPIHDFTSPDLPLDPLALSVSGHLHGLYDVRASCADPTDCTTLIIQPPALGYLPGETLTLTVTNKIVTAQETPQPLQPWTWQLTVSPLTTPVSVDAQGQADVSNLSFAFDADLFLEPPNETFTNGALGDIDGDSDIDAVVTTDAGRVLIWENQTCSPPIPPAQAPSCGKPLQFKLSSQTLVEDDYIINPERKARGVALADLNNDYLLDIFVFFDGLDRVWWQQPLTETTSDRFVRGAFLSDAAEDDTEDFELIGSSRTVDAILQDFNQDGYIDIFVANYKQPNTLWLNKQNQTFANSKIALGSDGTLSISAADLDNNGTLDVYIANDANDNIWYNNRDISFSSCNASLSTSITTRVSLSNFTTDDDDSSPNTIDIYLAQASTDSFFTIDPSSHQISNEKIINNSGYISTPDAGLVDLFDISSTSASEATSAFEVFTLNETTPPRLELLKLKFATEEKLRSDYVFQRIYLSEDPAFQCAQRLIPADLNQDQFIDFLIVNKRSTENNNCGAKIIMRNTSK